MWSGAPGIGRRLLIDEILHFISFYLFETIFWSAFCILHRHFCLSHSSHIHFDVAFMLCSHARHQSTMRIKFYIDVTSRANGSETAQKSCIIFDWWCWNEKHGAKDMKTKKLFDDLLLLSLVSCVAFSICFYSMWNDGAAWLMESINQTVRARCLLLCFMNIRISLWVQKFLLSFAVPVSRAPFPTFSSASKILWFFFFFFVVVVFVLSIAMSRWILCLLLFGWCATVSDCERLCEKQNFSSCFKKTKCSLFSLRFPFRHTFSMHMHFISYFHLTIISCRIGSNCKWRLDSQNNINNKNRIKYLLNIWMSNENDEREKKKHEKMEKLYEKLFVLPNKIVELRFMFRSRCSLAPPCAHYLVMR